MPIRFKKNFGVIDTNKKYGEELYEKIDTEKGIFSNAFESINLQLFPKLNLPPNIGIKLLNSIPYVQGNCLSFPDYMVTGGGWVDPGYKGHVTAQPNRFVGRKVLKKNDPLALGIIYKYSEPVNRPYGSEELKSHYQNSEGSVSQS